MDPRPDHLRSFVAVAEERHFGRAAQRLGIAQPAVSRHVRAVEEALGAQLLVRTSRETTLTAAGEAALAGGRRVLAELEALARAVDEGARGVRGAVTVAFVASTVSAWLAPFVTTMASGAPGLAVDPGQVPVAAVGERLRSGAVDVVVTRWADGDGLAAEPVGLEPTLAVLPPGHRLEDRDEIDLVELDGDPLIVSAARHWRAGFDALLASLREDGLACDDVREAAGPAAAVALVAAGEGVLLRPRTGVDPGVALARVPVRGRDSVIFAVRRAGPPDPAFPVVVDALRRVADGLGAGLPPEDRD